MIRLRPWLIIGAAMLLTAALVWLVISENRARAGGTEVALPLEGVDPRSLLSGHYVQLQFQETLARGAPCPAGLPSYFSGPPAWVALETSAGGSRVVGMADRREAARRLAPIVVRGGAWCSQVREDGAIVYLDIGLDRFHASQKEAEALQVLLRTPAAGGSRVFALVSVGRDGRARLNGLQVNGRRILLDWFDPAS